MGEVVMFTGKFASTCRCKICVAYRATILCDFLIKAGKNMNLPRKNIISLANREMEDFYDRDR